jgi:hypothetical protein
VRERGWCGEPPTGPPSTRRRPAALGSARRCSAGSGRVPARLGVRRRFETCTRSPLDSFVGICLALDTVGHVCDRIHPIFLGLSSPGSAVVAWRSEPGDECSAQRFPKCLIWPGCVGGPGDVAVRAQQRGARVGVGCAGGDGVDAVAPPIDLACEAGVFGEVEQQWPGGRGQLGQPQRAGPVARTRSGAQRPTSGWASATPMS